MLNIAFIPHKYRIFDDLIEDFTPKLEGSFGPSRRLQDKARKHQTSQKQSHPNHDGFTCCHGSICSYGLSTLSSDGSVLTAPKIGKVQENIEKANTICSQCVSLLMAFVPMYCYERVNVAIVSNQGL